MTMSIDAALLAIVVPIVVLALVVDCRGDIRMAAEAIAMTMSPELAALLTEREIDGALDRLAAARARVPHTDVNALAAIDADVALLKTERAWRERMRRKYDHDDASD
jgi:hypothetical protein